MRSAVIFNFLIEANIMASIAILLMIPLRKLLRKQIGNTAICFGWLFIALRLLCPLTLPNPFIHEIRPAYLDDTMIRPIAGQIKVRVVDAIGDLGRVFWQAGNRQAYGDLQKVAAGVDYNGYPAALAWIWLAGCMLVLLWFIYKNVHFRKALRKNRIGEISGELRENYLQLCRERKVKPVPVFFTDPVPGACLVGVFKPYIVLPVITSPEDVKNVLVHEICHLKNRDHLWGVVRLLCCAVHWFNPLVWIAASMSRTDSELRCDDRVTGPMNESERKEYANVLVLAAARKSMPGPGVMATGMTMTGKRLKNRVEVILQHKKPVRAFAVTFAVIAFACLVGAFATSETNMLWHTSFPDNYEGKDLTMNPEKLEYYSKSQEELDMLGTELWQSASMKEENIHTPFSLKADFERAEWRMTDSDGDLVTIYDGQGTLIGLQNNQSGLNESSALPIGEPNTPMTKMSEMEPEDLDQSIGEYITHFLTCFRPDLVSGRNYMQYLEERKNGEVYFAVFALRRTMMDEDDAYPAMIVLETYPDIRVVKMTTVPEEMTEPGQG